MTESAPAKQAELTLEMALAIVASCGSVELAARRIVRDFPSILVEDAHTIAMSAAGDLIATAPQQLNASFHHVCLYHNLREISEIAMQRGDIRTAMSAQVEMSRLVGSLS